MVKIFAQEVADAKNPNIPDGEYECIVSKSIERVSQGAKAAGSPMWEMRLIVTSPTKVNEIPTQGFELMTWITFCNEGAMSRMWQESVAILGFPVVKGQEWKHDPKEAEGRIIKVIVKNQPDQKGVSRSKVVKILKSEAQDDMGKVPF